MNTFLWTIGILLPTVFWVFVLSTGGTLEVFSQWVLIIAFFTYGTIAYFKN